MISIWEKNSFLTSDYLIVGAGLSGLSTAISLKEADPLAEVFVLEEHALPTGASTKNAGFACFGSPSEILDDYNNFGKDNALSLIEDRVKGLEILKNRIGDKNLDLKYEGGYELFFDEKELSPSHLEKLNEDLKYIFGEKVFFDKTEKIKDFGFGDVKKLIHTPFEGQLDAGKMIRQLLQKAGSMGILVLGGSKVVSFDEKENGVTVFTAKHSFSCKKLIVCTNAFVRQLIPELDIAPARGLVVSTHSVNPLPFKGSFHFDRGFYYFRTFGNQVIFGGGRNQDLKTEETTAFEISEKILQDLKEKLTRIILPGRDFEIELTWTGIMGFAETKAPVVKMVSENVAVAAGFGGMGVALSSLAGEKIASLISGF